MFSGQLGALYIPATGPGIYHHSMRPQRFYTSSARRKCNLAPQLDSALIEVIRLSFQKCFSEITVMFFSLIELISAAVLNWTSVDLQNLRQDKY